MNDMNAATSPDHNTQAKLDDAFPYGAPDLLSGKQEQSSQIEEPIAREVGAHTTFKNGRDYQSPTVRVVNSTYRKAQDHEKALFISQGRDRSISISLSTLEAIVQWAKSNG